MSGNNLESLDTKLLKHFKNEILKNKFRRLENIHSYKKMCIRRKRFFAFLYHSTRQELIAILQPYQLHTVQ